MKKVELNEVADGRENFPKMYILRVIDGQPNPTTHNHYAELLEGHYLLMTSLFISGREGEGRGVKDITHRGIVGLAHEVHEAEKILYERARSVADAYGRDFSVEIVDNTSFASGTASGD